jgi:hypothetical protein
MNYESRITAMTVCPATEPTWSEHATTVTIIDEAGEFVEVSQSGRPDVGKIFIDPEEWPVLRDTIDRMIGMCRGE